MNKIILLSTALNILATRVNSTHSSSLYYWLYLDCEISNEINMTLVARMFSQFQVRTSSRYTRWNLQQLPSCELLSLILFQICTSSRYTRWNLQQLPSSEPGVQTVQRMWYMCDSWRLPRHQELHSVPCLPVRSRQRSSQNDGWNLQERYSLFFIGNLSTHIALKVS